jgi:uracil-DNA glycosylase family 4
MKSEEERLYQFARLTDEVRACTHCPRMQDSGRILGLASGHLTAPLLFIGEAPGRLGADSTTIPFHGDRAGENFERLLAQAGLSRYDCFVTNAVLCNPRDEAGNNSTPTRHEVGNCSNFLRAQLDLVDPKIVVTLGAQALNALQVVEPHSLELSTSVRKCLSWYGRKLIPLYHPGQRAMLHRSFLNQLSDYRFIREQLLRVSGSQRKLRHNGQTGCEAVDIVRSIMECSGALSYFRLHKLFYLVEYHYAKQYGSRLTHSYVIRQKDGPYFTELHLSKLRRAIPELVVRSSAAKTTLSLNVTDDLFVGRETNAVQEFIRQVVERYRARTDEQLKTSVYLTPPMRRMLKREKYDGANLHNSPIEFGT